MNYILSKFSHELRNPLTSMYSALQIIEMQHPEVREFKYWSGLTHDVEYMNELLNQFSDFSKSEQLHLSTFSLRTLLEQVSLSFAVSIVDSGVEYTSKIAPSINQITGDKTKLQEVFLNILKNAFEASSPDKTVRLEASATDSEVTVVIRDTGCGMTEEQLGTIFEPFVTYKKNGTGLGLAICDLIIQAHGGTIHVDSTPNAGTSFTITLPLVS